MKIVYHRSKRGNFGDDLNAWLWERLAPGRWDDGDTTLFYGIGTIIGNPFPLSCEARAIIFSSGCGYSPIPVDWGNPRWTVAAVRGPLTAKLLGLPESSVVADGALLLSQLPELAPSSDQRRSGPIFIPHHTSLNFDGWREAACLAGISLVDPRGDSHEVIEKIRSSSVVLAESMHAAIIADTLRVPWVPIYSSRQIHTFKWLDWALSLGVPYEPRFVPAPSLAGAIDDRSRRLLGDVNYHRSTTFELVLDATKRQMNASYSRKRWLRRLIHTVPLRAARTRPMRDIAQIIDYRRVTKTAEALSIAANAGGILSDSAVLSAKSAELKHRFALVVG